MKLTSIVNLRQTVRFFAQTFLISIFVFGLIWGIFQWAKYEPPVEPNPEGSILLSAPAAQLKGSPQIKLESLVKEKNLGYWDFDSQWISWDVDVKKIGNYSVELNYARPGKSSVDLILQVGENSLITPVAGTGGWKNWKKIPMGVIHLSKMGKQTITLKTKNPPSEGIINYISILLIPQS